MTRYLSLDEFWYLAEHVTGIDAATLGRVGQGRGARVSDRVESPVARRQQAREFPTVSTHHAVRVTAREIGPAPAATAMAVHARSMSVATMIKAPVRNRPQVSITAIHPRQRRVRPTHSWRE